MGERKSRDTTETTAMSKIKILLFGAVGDHLFPVLIKKLQSLNSSKAGPFDVCFVVGTTCAGRLAEQMAALSEGDVVPLPVYLQHVDDESEASPLPAAADDGGIVSLGKNVHYLRGKAGTGDGRVHLFVIDVPNHEHPMVVASCPRHARAGGQTTADGAAASHSRPQQQCDLMLSFDWPQGMEDVLHVDTEPLSYDVAQAALEFRPRYHVCPSTRLYHASPPYRLPNSDHVGRFLALAPVVAEPPKPPKNAKFVHALGLEPLAAGPPPTTAPSTLPCPFLATQLSQTATTVGSKTAPVPKFALPGNGDPTSAYSRFAVKGGNKRGRNGDDGGGSKQGDGNVNSLEPPDDPTVSTLFLYGLHKDVTGELQSTSSPKVLFAFSKYGVTKVRHPPGTGTSTYCFLEFPSQREAHACLLDCQGRITIDGVDLTLKWAAQRQQQQPTQQQKRQRRDELQQHFVSRAEAGDSATLFFHPPKGGAAGASGGCGETAGGTDAKRGEREAGATVGAMEDGFAEALRRYLEGTLEDALNEGAGDGEERVTAETEPALKVGVRTKDHYGFLEFASHAAATMALAALTKSTDGGLLLPEPEGAPAPSPSLVGTTLRWAKGAPPANKNKGEREEILEALGLKRQYYPADSRTDCWFCLASPTCETHLITGVYNEWYATMPKGPVHPGHVLLVPVTHTGEGAWTLSDEWVKLVEKLEEHASVTYDMDLFVFERSMETRGGYHTHVQCIPIPRDSTVQLRGVMMAHAKASGFDLRAIQSDLGVKALIQKSDSYFYAEVRAKSQQHRFLYRREAGDESAANVPLQFAREVLASVLNNPKLAHWKACVVDKEQETELASTFRTSFNTIL